MFSVTLINNHESNLSSMNGSLHKFATYLFLSQHLLDAHGLHGGEGLSPFQKALRDSRNLFSVEKIQNLI